MDTPVRDIPSHVPMHLVYDYDTFTTPSQFESPHWEVTKLLYEQAPPIFFTPRNGGHWVVTRSADIVEMYRHPEVFSSDPQYNKLKRNNPTRHLPQFYDPPEHTDARKIMAPFFVPGAVQAMEPQIRQLARELIDAVYDRGSCEFVKDVAQRYPVTIFLQMANGPLSEREALIDMAARYLQSPDPAISQSGIRDLANFLSGLIEERRKALGDDLVSRIITGSFMGRPLTHDEVLGGAVFMFLAGLHTVIGMLSFVIMFLARNPDHYKQLVDDPDRLTNAIEELMRVSGVAMPERGVKDDTVYKGIQFRKYDRIVYLVPISGLDHAEIDQPFTVDFDRELSRHLVFGSGIHRCLGSHLARIEIRVFVEEWIARIPAFSVKDGVTVQIRSGTNWEPLALPLVWRPESAKA